MSKRTERWVLTNPMDCDDPDDAPVIEIELPDKVESEANQIAREIHYWSDRLRVENAEIGWRAITSQALTAMLPRRQPKEREIRNPPYHTEDGISILCDADWQTNFEGQRFEYRVEKATVNGLEIMRIDNGFTSNPFYIR